MDGIYTGVTGIDFTRGFSRRNWVHEEDEKRSGSQDSWGGLGKGDAAGPSSAICADESRYEQT